MRFPCLLPTALMAGTLLLGCGDHSGPLELDDDPQVSLRSGAVVTRSEEGAVFGVDPESGLSSLLGWTLADLEQFCATGEPPIGSLQVLTVDRPHGTEEHPDRHLLVQGIRAPLLVWQTANPDLCGVLLELPHLTGTGNYIRTDNDLFTTGTRGNAGHEGIHGKVTSETGERFRFSLKFHVVILPSGDVRDSFELQLEPIGS